MDLFAEAEANNCMADARRWHAKADAFRKRALKTKDDEQEKLLELSAYACDERAALEERIATRFRAFANEVDALYDENERLRAENRDLRQAIHRSEGEWDAEYENGEVLRKETREMRERLRVLEAREEARALMQAGGAA